MFANYDSHGLAAGALAFWPDTSGLGNDTSTSIVDATAGTFGGEPGVDFAPGTPAYDTPNPATGPLSVFCVGNLVVAVPGQQFYGQTVRLIEDFPLALALFESTELFTSTTLAADAKTAVGAIFNGASSSYEVQPAADSGSGDTGSVPAGGAITIGSTDRTFAGVMRQVLIYEGALSPTDFSAVMAWLVSRWSV